MAKRRKKDFSKKLFLLDCFLFSSSLSSTIFGNVGHERHLIFSPHLFLSFVKDPSTLVDPWRTQQELLCEALDMLLLFPLITTAHVTSHV